MHPLNPRHPQYASLVEAGRAGSIANRVGVAPEPRDPMLCTYLFEDRFGEALCDEPATTVVTRSDGLGVTFRICDDHLGNYSGLVPFCGDRVVTWVVARVSCSSCDTDAQRLELDSSGRCDD